MALADALSVFAPHDGRLVHLTVSQNEFRVEPATEDDEAAWIAQKQSERRSLDLEFDFECAEIRNLRDFERDNAIGSKARHLRQMMAFGIPNVNFGVSEVAFVIPFHYFHEFTVSVAGDDLRLLFETRNEAQLKTLAASIRAKIEAGPLGEELRLHFSQIDPETFGDGLIFRSSTNCEDLPGFPSAGLYRSEAVTENSWAAFARAIRSVWASTYSDKAILERREFGIDERQVGMAVIIMPLLRSSVKANGVGLTINPFRLDLGGAYANAQVGTVAVTDSCHGQIAEQVLFVRDDPAQMAMQYIASSSLLGSGQYIIDRAIGAKLHLALVTLRRMFEPIYGFQSPVTPCNAMDVEFFVLKNDDLVIVQARPIAYQVREEKKLR
jgi:hypothetical protein